jgi:signal transduction histidine kinase/ABC-type multidrug transport system ATPase subunit
LRRLDVNAAEAQTAQVSDRPARGPVRTPVTGSALPERDRDDGTALLSVRELSVRFGPLSALEAVNLDVHPGELVAVAGENGAGKTTLVACVAGDIAPSSGRILLDGRALPPRLRAATRRGVAIVRQHTELCGNLDIAANLFLGREGNFFLNDVSLYGRASAALEEWKIPLPDLSTKVGALSGGMRQLLTVARVMLDRPRLLVLDEPTFSLGANETAQVEELIASLHQQGTTILLVSHDVDQMFRLADRIVILRHGRLVADVDPLASHPDDVIALLSGQKVDSSARRQLVRLQGLVDQLASTDPSSSLSVILSSLGAALNNKCLSVHLREGDVLRCAATLGFPRTLPAGWAEVPYGSPKGPIGQASVSEQVLVDEDIEHSAGWAQLRGLARTVKAESSWTVPVMGSSGLIGVITILRPTKGVPQRDELDLVRLYAGYAASAIERDRLLSDLTSRNRVLETIREVLETLTGSVSVPDGFAFALRTLRRGLQADEVLLQIMRGHDGADSRCFTEVAPSGASGASGRTLPTRAGDGGAASSPLSEAVSQVLAGGPHDGKAKKTRPPGGGLCVAVPFPTEGGVAVLVVRWDDLALPEGSTDLMEDAARSFQLALEREDAVVAHQETAALRRSQEMQQGFLSRLSHELRTPLTAIRGYASSLLQPDVTWDGDSQQRFLNTVAVESARLGRLVEDLLDFSAIESGILRLQSDWCDLALVLEAAVGCLPAPSRAMVRVLIDPSFPAVWADHDRMEQVLLNLIDNALRHNPDGTYVEVSALIEGATAAICVTDDGTGVPDDVAGAFFEPKNRRRTLTAGAGLGLSIARGIVEAHGGQIELRRPESGGTQVRVSVPVEGTGRGAIEAVGAGSST